MFLLVHYVFAFKYKYLLHSFISSFVTYLESWLNFGTLFQKRMELTDASVSIAEHILRVILMAIAGT